MINLDSLAIAEKHEEVSALNFMFDRQEFLDRIEKLKNDSVEMEITSPSSEYFYLAAPNIMEAIIESGSDFESAMAKAVAENNAEAVLTLIKSASKSYWINYVREITD